MASRAVFESTQSASPEFTELNLILKIMTALQ